MTRKIPTWQRLFQRLVLTRPITAFMVQVLHHVDTFLLRLSDGRLDITRLAGLPVVQLTTIGAKSGLPRRLPLAGYPDGEKIVLIASNYGQAHHPGWYFNLKANPECVLQRNGHTKSYLARETERKEREIYWNLAGSYFTGYEAYRLRAAPRQIPVMLLEPKD